jgi:hypothetical protein
MSEAAELVSLLRTNSYNNVPLARLEEDTILPDQRPIARSCSAIHLPRDAHGEVRVSL